MKEPILWLLEGSPWVQYRTRLDLLDQPEDHPEVVRAREEMIAHPQVRNLLEELLKWPGPVLKSHKSAGLLIHKLTFAADLGLRAGDPQVDVIIDKVMAHQSDSGPFQTLVNIHPKFGGSGRDEWNWMLCDAPLLLYALIRLGMDDDARVQESIVYLIDLVRENGWPCAASSELGKFRGPGRKEDPCPYANLVMTKALATSQEWRDSPASSTGTEAALALWAERRERHPYMFYMGTDFSKLKAPLIWYDILHLLDVLSQFTWLRQDPRLVEIANIARRKADDEGRFTPESIWMAWKGWSFGQKREPSRWLTLLVHRALKGIG
ncbi:MAG: hypothetical protein GTO18_22465 [Anaerolineales bacterium]|nr:hypothetical protein [Anaerolineales bacterium]